jgi:hypothetical protein
MKTGRIFWGIILVYIGGIILLQNFNIIDFNWRFIWRFWPIVLVFAGVNMLFSSRNSKIGVLLMAVLTIVFLGLFTYKGLQEDRNRNGWGWMNSWENKEDTVENREGNYNTIYSEDFLEGYKKVKLEVSGGAGEFNIEEETDKLIVTQMERNRFQYVLKKTDYDSLTTLEFKPRKNKNVKFGGEDINIQLNKNPIWDLNLNIGAGKLNFDLQNFKVSNVNVNGGAAEFNVKLGDLLDEVYMDVETGVASVNIDIPENVGCSIKNSNGLSSRNFEGFTDLGHGNYETPNFKTSTKKIYINLKGGLSDFNVKRYAH